MTAVNFTSQDHRDSAKILIPQIVRKCMNHLKRKEYDLGITTKDVNRACSLMDEWDARGRHEEYGYSNWWRNQPYILLVTDTKHRGATYAGADVIRINLGYWQFNKESTTLTEYKAFGKNSVYGDREVTCVEDKLWVMVAHEVAHHVQYGFAQCRKSFKQQCGKAHGDGFQTIYRWLRLNVVNPIIDENIRLMNLEEVKQEVEKQEVEKQEVKRTRRVQVKKKIIGHPCKKCEGTGWTRASEDPDEQEVVCEECGGMRYLPCEEAEEQKVCSNGKESKEEKFKRLAEVRVNKLIESLRLLGNLSNKNNYAYTDDDIIEMLGKIRTEIRTTKKRFFS